MTVIYYTGDYLAHHGIKGQKWGIRNYQNEDGTLTAAGKDRYRDSPGKIQRDLNRLDRQMAYRKGDGMKLAGKARRLERKANRYYKRNPNDEKGKGEKLTAKMKEYTDQAKALKKADDIDAAMKRGLMRVAQRGNMNVTLKEALRSTECPGEAIVKRTLAMAGAMAMATVSPVGVGFYSTTPPVKGTKYKVRRRD